MPGFLEVPIFTAVASLIMATLHNIYAFVCIAAPIAAFTIYLQRAAKANRLRVILPVFYLLCLYLAWGVTVVGTGHPPTGTAHLFGVLLIATIVLASTKKLD